MQITMLARNNWTNVIDLVSINPSNIGHHPRVCPEFIGVKPTHSPLVTTTSMRESVNLLSLTKWMNDWPVTLRWLTTRRKESKANECYSPFPQWPWWGRWSPSVSSSSRPLTCFSLPVRSRRHPSSCLSTDDRARTLERERENSLHVSILYPDWLCEYQCLEHKHILLDNDHQKTFKCNIKWRHIHYVCVCINGSQEQE